MESKNIKYIPGLDHIRAYAVILVLVYHTLGLFLNHRSSTWIYTKNFLMPLFLEGHTGVAIFMVSSGFIFFVITYGKEVYYWRFILNRFFRIYPLFLFMIFAGIAIYPNEFNFVFFLQTILGFANVTHIRLNVGPFLIPVWAISVEFIFYLVFPILMKITQKKINFLKLIFMFIIFRTFGFLLTGNIIYTSYTTILGRMDQFLIGMFLAFIYIKSKELRIFENKLLNIVYLIISIVFVFLIISIYHQLGGWIVEKWWKIFWVDIEALVWSIFIFFYLNVFNKSYYLLNKIGEYSFSIYLIHYVILRILFDKELYFIFTSNLLINTILNALLIVTPITVFISYFTYNLIEKPFLKMRVKYLKTDV